MLENVDKDTKAEFQLWPSNKKDCRYCKSPIHIQAKVCHYCGRHQKRFWNHFRIDHIGLIIAFAIVILSYLQYNELKKERTKVTEALNRILKAEEKVGELDNLVKETKSLLEFNFLVTKANGDDRDAFDRLVEIAQESGPFQCLAKKAKVRINSLPETLPQNTSTVKKLKEFGYAELLRYYHEFPPDNINSSSVLVAIHEGTRLTHKERFEFFVTMIDKDESRMVVKRACLFIKPLLEEFRQTKPGAYNRAINQCKVYVNAWE